MPRVCRLRGVPSSASDFRFTGIDRGASNGTMDGTENKSVEQTKQAGQTSGGIYGGYMDKYANYKRIMRSKQTQFTKGHP